MKPFFFFLTLIGTSTFFTPYYVPSIEGQWVGQITQNDGGYLPNYSCELFFQVDDDGRIYGRSYVRAPGVQGTMSFEVEKRGDIYYLEEKELIDGQKPEDLSWCFKTMQLRMVNKGNKWSLQGPWQGKSEYGDCVPGWLVLEPAVPRP